MTWRNTLSVICNRNVITHKFSAWLGKMRRKGGIFATFTVWFKFVEGAGGRAVKWGKIPLLSTLAQRDLEGEKMGTENSDSKSNIGT